MMTRRLLLAGSVCSVLLACGGARDERGTDTASADSTTRADTAAPVAGTAFVLGESGLGPIRVGMTVAEASAATSGDLVARPGAAADACQYLEWRGGVPGVGVMAEQGYVARVDVDSGVVATESGARIGDGEARVRELYGDRVAEMPHKYVAGGKYLVVTPASGDTTLRLVFETEGGRVTRFRGGRMPQVMYVERCG